MKEVKVQLSDSPFDIVVVVVVGGGGRGGGGGKGEE